MDRTTQQRRRNTKKEWIGRHNSALVSQRGSTDGMDRKTEQHGRNGQEDRNSTGGMDRKTEIAQEEWTGRQK